MKMISFILLSFLINGFVLADPGSPTGGASGGGSGGLGGSFPAHYSWVINTLRIPDTTTDWKDIKSHHIAQLAQTLLENRELGKIAKTQMIEVIFKAVTLHSKNFDYTAREHVIRFWDSYLYREVREKMPSESTCRNGMERGNQADVEKGCGLTRFGISLNPQGSWLMSFGVYPAETWDKVRAFDKPFKEMNAEQTMKLLFAGMGRIRDFMPLNAYKDPERDFLLQIGFRRLLHFKEGIDGPTRERIGRSWTGVMRKEFRSGQEEHDCINAFVAVDTEKADRACLFDRFPFKTILDKKEERRR